MDRIRRHFNVGSATRSSNIKSRDSVGFSGSTQLVFGVSLEEISARCGLTCGVPKPFARMVATLDKRALELEGIFRVNGNARTIESLRQEFDTTGDADLDNCTDVYAIAGALKLFLRELPNGLVSSSFTSQFTAVVDAANISTLSKGGEYYTTTGSSDLSGCSSSDGSSGSRNHTTTSLQCLEKYAHLLVKLPEINRRTLAYLCRFLNRVADPRYLNKMNAVSLAICFGPNVFRCTNSLSTEHGGGGGAGGSLQGLRDQSLSNQVMAHFIEHYDQLLAPILAPKAVPAVIPTTDCVIAAESFSDLSAFQRKRRCRRHRSASRDKEKRHPQEDTQSSSSSDSGSLPPPLYLDSSFDNLLADEDLAIFMPRGLMTAAAASSTASAANLKTLVEVVAATSVTVSAPGSKPWKKSAAAALTSPITITNTSPEVTPVDCMRIRERIAAAEAERLKEGTSSELLQESVANFARSCEPKPKARLSLRLAGEDLVKRRTDDSSILRESETLCSTLPSPQLNKQNGWVNGSEFDNTKSIIQTSQKLFSLRSTIRSIVALNIFGSIEEAEAVLDYSNFVQYGYVSDVLQKEVTHLTSPLDVSYHDPRHSVKRTKTTLFDEKKSLTSGSFNGSVERKQSSNNAASKERCMFPSSEEPMYSSSSSSGTYDSSNSRAARQHLFQLESTFDKMKRNIRSSNYRTKKDTSLKLKSNSKITDDNNQSNKVTPTSSLCRSAARGTQANIDLNLKTISQFPTMMDTLEYINVHLISKRLEADRPESLSAMTFSQINDEKLALQKALLIFEQTHGRPKSNSDKEVMKPLYDRYRAVKRLLSSNQTSIAAVDEDNGYNCQIPDLAYNGRRETAVVMPDAAVDLAELLNERNCVETNKKTLQKQLKLFEKSFEEKTGRAMMREDRVHMAAEYNRYKQIKTRLKQLNDLIQSNT